MNFKYPRPQMLDNILISPCPCSNGYTLNILVSIMLKLMTALSLISLSFTSSANPFSMIEPTPMRELWINPGFYSFHFQKDKGLNNSNFGLGADFRYSSVSSLTLGVFDNSDRKSSRYIGWYWQPIQFETVRLGAVIGAIDGYPKMQDGSWYLAVIPSASVEYKRFGANIMFVPSYKDRLYGAISLQLKLKVFDSK